jgi:hypothetical protein
MATATFAEMLLNTQHSSRLIKDTTSHNVRVIYRRGVGVVMILYTPNTRSLHFCTVE